MSIEQQVSILNRLVQIMDKSIEGDYESMECKFDYHLSTDDGSWSVGSCFSFIQKGKKISAALKGDVYEDADLIHDLHSIMQEHTGGNWKEFILTVDETGKAKTKFIYE